MDMRRIGIMIGSPGDAGAERGAVTEAILRWNAHSGRSIAVYLEPVRWETHATPGLQGRPQGMINEELIPLSHILIAMFRARAGSPTGEAVSGTIEEIREFMRLGKYVVLYFYEGDVPLTEIDPDQLAAIRDFRKEIQQHGLTDSYRTVDELTTKLPHQLSAIVSKLLSDSPIDAVIPETVGVNSTSLPLSGLAPDTSTRVAPQESQLVISDSGRWALLDTAFYETQSVRQTSDGNWIVEIRSNSAQIDAHLSSLRPQQYGRSRPMPFAHRNDGFLIQVKSIESVSEGDGQVWTVTMAPEEVHYGGGLMDITYQTAGKTYTPDDFARLRAGRILLNDPAPMVDIDGTSIEKKIEEAMLESQIRGTNNPVSVEHCVVQVVYRLYGDDLEKFLRLARLASIYSLKASGVAERILELTLGPIEAESVHVHFRGRRRQVYTNLAPTEIEIEGKCQLESM